MTEIGQFSAPTVQGHERFGGKKQTPVAAQTCRFLTRVAADQNGADHAPAQ
jgi:hypothetical protein